MADWDKISSRGNVEDRRAMGGAGIALGGGTTLLLVGGYIVLNLLGVKVDPAILEQVIGSGQMGQTSQVAPNDSYDNFASTVLGSVNDYWRPTLKGEGVAYKDPRLVLFRQATQSGCGIATSQVGPHYCPPDQTIYLDETFFDELKRLGGDNGDVAQAYVIAHEAGHHIQQELGTMDKVTNDPNYQRTGKNSLSVRLELQADCYAGLWANSIKNRDIFGPNEIQEAISAAEAVGDDRIQSQTQGSINPETWTHGSASERAAAFDRGYNSGKLSSCQL